MANENVLVSVVMPTYGRSEYLPRAVESVLNQTHHNLELVIINDNVIGSDEDIKTQEVIKSYNADPRVVSIKTKGKTGGGAARNQGLEICRGAYIAFLDDDDRYLPEKIEKQLAFTIENALDMSYQDVQWYDSNEKLVEYRRHDRVNDFSPEGLMRVHLQVSIAPTSIYMVRRAALEGVAGFGEVPRGQDFYFMVHCIQANMKIGYMPGAYVIQYLHEGERISVGPQFIKNVQEEWADKKRLAQGILSPKEIRFMDFRLNCICGFACLRGHEKGKAIPYFARAFMISPIDSVKEGIRYFQRK